MNNYKIRLITKLRKKITQPYYFLDITTGSSDGTREV